MRVTSLFDHVRQQWIRGCINTHVFSDGLQWCFTSTVMFFSDVLHQQSCSSVMFYINTHVLQWCFTSTVMFSVTSYFTSHVLRDVLHQQCCFQWMRAALYKWFFFLVVCCAVLVHMMTWWPHVHRWGAGVETQKNVRGEIGGWGRVPFNEPYAPSLSTIYDGA